MSADEKTVKETIPDILDKSKYDIIYNTIASWDTGNKKRFDALCDEVNSAGGYFSIKTKVEGSSWILDYTFYWPIGIKHENRTSIHISTD